MTIEEAIKEMKLGKKMTHSTFTSEEWITILGNKFLFEDGVQCDQEEFWKYRLDEIFKINWEFY